MPEHAFAMHNHYGTIKEPSGNNLATTREQLCTRALTSARGDRIETEKNDETFDTFDTLIYNMLKI